MKLVLVTEHLDQVVSGVGLWSLQRHTKGTVPAELSEDTEGTGDTEEDSVVVLLDKTIVLEEDTRVGINVRPWVLGLSVLSQDAGLKGELLLFNSDDDTLKRINNSHPKIIHTTMLYNLLTRPKRGSLGKCLRANSR